MCVCGGEGGGGVNGSLWNMFGKKNAPVQEDINPSIYLLD